MRRFVALLFAALACAAAPAGAEEDETSYGELDILLDYEESGAKLGHLSLGAAGRAMQSYYDSKKKFAERTGFSWLIEIAPQFQYQIDGGTGSTTNNESNLIGQWSIVDKQDSGKGNLIFWYQFSSTWGSRTTTEFMQGLGVESAVNGGDTFPDKSRDLMQHFAWEQKFANDKLRIQLGKLTTRVLFNLNRYAVGDREDFFSPMLVNNPVVHYTARIGFGAFAEFKKDNWYVSGMIRDADADLSKRFIDFDSLSTGNWEYLAEFALTPDKLFGLGEGVYRVTFSRSDATGEDSNQTPSSSSVSLSFDQDLSERFGAYFRYADSNDTFRTFEKRIALGGQIKRPLGFENDRIGIGLWRATPLDGDLRSETGIEAYWMIQLAQFMEFSAGAQVIFDPAIKTDRSRSTLAEARLRLLF